MDTFKTLAWDRLTSNAFTLLVSRLPILGLGPLGYIARWVFVKITDLIYEQIKLQVELKQIQFKNDDYNREFLNASTELRIIGVKYGFDSISFKDAHKRFVYSLDKLASF